MSEQTCDLGMVGLGVMGRNLLLNLAEHDYRVAGFDKDPAKVAALLRKRRDVTSGARQKWPHGSHC